MDDQQKRMLVERHWNASAAGDQNAEHEIYRDDVTCEYPQSAERIRGRHNLQAVRSTHPDRPRGFHVRRILGCGDLWLTEYEITYEGGTVYTVSIMEFRDGQVWRETQYFASPFVALSWRQHLVEHIE